MAVVGLDSTAMMAMRDNLSQYDLQIKISSAPSENEILRIIDFLKQGQEMNTKVNKTIL